MNGGLVKVLRVQRAEESLCREKGIDREAWRHCSCQRGVERMGCVAMVDIRCDGSMFATEMEGVGGQDERLFVADSALNRKGIKNNAELKMDLRSSIQFCQHTLRGKLSCASSDM